MNDLPVGWAEGSVSDLLERDIGGVWGRPPGEDEVDVRVIRVADFRDDGVASLSSAPLRSITARQLASREARAGDVLLEKSGGGPTKPVGRVVRVLANPEPVVPTNFVQLLRPAASLVEPGYLFWWLWHSHASGAPSAFQRATTNIRNLRTKDYLSRLAPLPPLNEQRRIVSAIEEHLSRLDAADASLLTAAKRIEAYNESLDSQMLSGWDSRTLGSLCPIFVDCPHRTPSYDSEGIPALRPRDVVGGKLELAGAARVSPKEFEIQTKRRVPEVGDVIYSRELSYGWAVVVPTDTQLCLSQGMVLFRPDDSVLPEFLMRVLNSSIGRNQAKAVATGTAHPHINLRDIRAYEIPVPPLDEQRRIVQEVEERLSRIDAMRASIERAQARSKALRAAILERAFRGELVPQDPSDEPAEALLARIRAERDCLPNA